jgi:DNA-binding FrmR family transcriptional regulator
MIDDHTRQQIDRRLSRVAGQVGGIQRMIDADRYCVDTLLQIAAARAALARVGRILLESHINTCVVGAISAEDPSDQQAKIEELLHVFDKYT